MLLTYRPRTWHLIVVALIVVFDAIVLYMVLFPNVPADYRAYYIERTTSCFPRMTSSYYPLGEPVSFVPGRSGYDRDTIRWCGFMPAKNDGIKSFGDYGILKLRFAVPDKDLLLTFSSWANTNASQPVRQVKVIVNGDQVGTLGFDSAKRVNGRIVIPQVVAKAGDHGLEIRFEVPRIGPPGTNTEPVTLQLRLEALRVVPLDMAPPVIEPGVVERPVVAPAKKEAGSLPPPKLR